MKRTRTIELQNKENIVKKIQCIARTTNAHTICINEQFKQHYQAGAANEEKIQWSIIFIFESVCKCNRQHQQHCLQHHVFCCESIVVSNTKLSGNNRKSNKESNFTSYLPVRWDPFIVAESATSIQWKYRWKSDGKTSLNRFFFFLKSNRDIGTGEYKNIEWNEKTNVAPLVCGCKRRRKNKLTFLLEC